MEFKDRLKELRKEKGLTQKELGKKINVAESTISHYETGLRTPDYSILKVLAAIFNVSTDYLLCRINDPTGSVILETGNKYFTFHKDVPMEAREDIINYAEYVIKKHEEKKNKGMQ